MTAAAPAAAQVSAAALQAGAGAALYPEPEWIRAAADDLGYDWARLAWRRAASVPGAWFDAAKADAAVRIWPTVFRLTNDRFAGKPFHLLFWQEVIVRLLVGWKVPVEVADEDTGAVRFEHVRLFRRLMLWVPRKNGKSEFLAALSLLFFALDGPFGGEGYIFARDEKQARRAFDKMKSMVSFSPQLQKSVKVYKSSLWVQEIQAKFELLTGKAEGKHGPSPSVIFGDEMHEWRSDDMMTFLRQGTGTRLQPIELYASTAGLKSNRTGWALWEESCGILDGRIEDASTLVVIFAADPAADWTDEEVWRRPNPSLGRSPTIAFLRREAAIAKDNPRAEANFRRYHLNQWVEATVRWLNLKKWDACTSDPEAWARYAAADCNLLRGRKCFGALDVSSTQDVTALLWLFPPCPEDEAWRLACRFWVPEETVDRRVRQDRVPYDRWVASGAMSTTPGDYVDQSFVQAAIGDGLGLYDVAAIGFDPWNARKLYTDMVNDGMDAALMVEMRQGIRTLGEPSRHFERMVYAGDLDHGGHPVLRWMAGNAEVRFDENMNFMPAKKTSAEKIDGIVAAVMAAGLAMAGEPDGMDDYLKSMAGAS